MTHSFGKSEPTAPLVFNIRPDAPCERTLLMMGIGRGGTSATAAVIDAIGVPMGASTQPFETWEFKEDLNNPPKWKSMLAKIVDLNSRHPKWGAQVWNNPSSAARIAAEVRNPYLLIVFRDLVALTERLLSFPRETRSGKDILEQMFMETTRLLVHLTTMSMPIMVVSFERLRIQPAHIVPHIAAFMGMTPPDALLQEAVSRVNLQGGYLSHTG